MDPVIRKMTEDDLEPLHALLSDPQVMQYLEPPFTMEQTANFLSAAGLSEPPLVYAVEKEHSFAGYVIYHEYDANSMEIGWALYPEHWGKGFASHLTEQLIQRGLSAHKQLVIECVPEQKATRRLDLKYGFDYEGRIEGLDVFRLPTGTV